MSLGKRKHFIGRRIIFVLLSFCLSFILILSGCRGKQSERPDLSSLGEIHSIGREEGSGTREQFDELVDTDENTITMSVSSTEELIETVSNDPSAIGYAAMSAIQDDANINILSVDGVFPSTETVKNKKYPLTRSYYLAWMGDQSDLEQEFITYAQGAGQKYVAQVAVPTGDETSFLSLKPSGTLKITGSTSMCSLVKKIAEGYKTYNPNADIEVTESDSTQGLQDVMQGRADLAMSSRDLKDYEKEILSYDSIASDAIVMIVNSKNSLTDLSRTELKDIFDGKVTVWNDL